MPVMRSVFYIPGNNDKMIAKAPTTPADIITLDLEDSVPPAEKPKARDMVRESLKLAGSGGSTVYVRINNWETLMTNDDLEAIVHEGLSGVCLAKTGGPDHVQRLEWKLEELERRRGLPVGKIAIQLLIETAKGVINAYPSAIASKRVNSLIFGAVDYTKDMRVKLTSEGVEQFYARSHTAVAARAAGCIAIDCPFVDFRNIEAFEKSTREGRQMGYEGRMLIHPTQIEPSNRIYSPAPEDVEWAKGVVKVFEEEGIAKGMAAVSYKGKMVDTPVYDNARTILATLAEIEAFDKKRKQA
jgi:citrate lyase subunit beta/citryl-CoA lyase